MDILVWTLGFFFPWIWVMLTDLQTGENNPVMVPPFPCRIFFGASKSFEIYKTWQNDGKFWTNWIPNMMSLELRFIGIFVAYSLCSNFRFFSLSLPAQQNQFRTKDLRFNIPIRRFGIWMVFLYKAGPLLLVKSRVITPLIGATTPGLGNQHDVTWNHHLELKIPRNAYVNIPKIPEVSCLLDPFGGFFGWTGTNIMWLQVVF